METIAPFTADDVARASKCARHLLSIGLYPIPSRHDDKRPALDEFSKAYDGSLPGADPDNWDTPNIQVICGTETPGRQKIIVVDLDSDRAVQVFEEMTEKYKDGWTQAHGRVPWIVNTGSGGKHLYFAVPRDVKKVKTRVIWGRWDTWGRNGKSGWSKHEEVKILGDRSMAIFPPSIHVVTGERYKFVEGFSPLDSVTPRDAPPWLLAMPGLDQPVFEGKRPKIPKSVQNRPGGTRVENTDRFVERNRTLNRIPDKLEVALYWGLRTKSDRPNASGWVCCYAVDREEKNPSASFSVSTGTYQDKASNRTISFFDLGVALNHFDTWQDCMKWCDKEWGDGL
jgi:hypothetical protein